ncbi:MAG: tRNA (adenosine(37)-N6)-threonylcarbamoyltransferase complex dimerization subunit type 1 TsaB [Candidatus Omnitrophota bacterium]|nr:MAG: tRNA (adenosine(37)-N6)-threonylcarbamoyltransferase complex dimerization subunit type 1 TsaB [Candidatus Omnitrophota bacterium]
MDNTYILTIDTHSKFLIVVIAKNGIILSRYKRVQARQHCRLLIPTVEILLNKAGLCLNDIDYLSVNIGPGSFTGLRIGLASVKGLSMAVDKPIIAFSSLEALAFCVKNQFAFVCPLIDAKRGQVYSALYAYKTKSLSRITDYFLCPVEQVLKDLKGKVIFTGDGLNLYAQQIKKYKNINAMFAPQKLWYPNTANLAKLSYDYYQKRKFFSAKELSALYLYSESCTMRLLPHQ